MRTSKQHVVWRGLRLGRIRTTRCQVVLVLVLVLRLVLVLVLAGMRGCPPQEIQGVRAARALWDRLPGVAQDPKRKGSETTQPHWRVLLCTYVYPAPCLEDTRDTRVC